MDTAVNLNAPDAREQSQGLVVSNNLITAGIGIGCSGFGNTELFNNIYSLEPPGIALIDNDGTAPLFPCDVTKSDFNLYHRGDRFLQNGTNIQGLGNWQAQSGLDANSLTGDPLLGVQDGQPFVPQPGSPAIDNGRAGGVPSGGIVDIGAFPQGPRSATSPAGAVVGPGNRPQPPSLLTSN